MADDPQPQTLDELVTSLWMGLDPRHSSKPRDTGLELSARHFESVNGLKQAVSTILYKYDCGQLIDKEDEALLLELFHHHPQAAERLEDFSYFTVGQHQGEYKMTRCFLIVDCLGKRTDISYLKCIDQLAHSSKPAPTLPRASDIFIDILADLAQKNQVQVRLSELAKASTAQLRLSDGPLVAVLLKLAHKVPSLACIVMPAAVQLSVKAETSRQRPQELLEALAESLQTSAFAEFLRAFEEWILPSTALPQTSGLVLSAGLRPECEEEFLSLLINKMFALEQVPQAAAYLVSFLSKTDSHILVPSAAYLLKFSKKAIVRKETRPQGYTVLKYLCYLCCAQPLVLEEISEGLKKLFKSRKINIKRVAFDYSIDPSGLLDRIGFKGFVKREELELPFRRHQPNKTPSKRRRTEDIETLSLETEESDIN
jgi:hypothetical protein